MLLFVYFIDLDPINKTIKVYMIRTPDKIFLIKPNWETHMFPSTHCSRPFVYRKFPQIFKTIIKF